MNTKKYANKLGKTLRQGINFSPSLSFTLAHNRHISASNWRRW